MKKAKYYGVAALFLFVSVVTLVPVVFMLLGSFMSSAEVTAAYGDIFSGSITQDQYAAFHLLPNQFTLEQYYQVLLRNQDFLIQFWNSVMISLPALCGVVIIATLGGYGFAQFRFPGSRILFVFYIIVSVLPYQVTMVPNFLVAHSLHLLGTRWAVILPAVFTPFGVYIVYQFMRKIPRETLEYARVEGAGELTIFAKIVLPQAAPGIASLVILNLIDTWSMVEQPLALIQNSDLYPLSAALSSINQGQIGIAFACGMVFFLPLLLVFLLLKDELVDGVSNSVIRKL